MTEMKEATIFDPSAHIEAIAIRFDTGSETWQLQSIGTVEECRASCDRARNKGCEHEMRLYRVGMWVPDRSQHGNHGWIENVQQYAQALAPDGQGTIERKHFDADNVEIAPIHQGTMEGVQKFDRALSPEEVNWIRE